MSNKFIRLNDDILKCLRGEKSDPKIGCMLENQEFLIKDDIDEKVLVNNLFMQRRYSSKVYQLILNTTLDCNLCCWYCYETHTMKSYMTLDIVDKILKHIELKSQSAPFEILDLYFFGGEPMLNYKAISALLPQLDILAHKFQFKIELAFVTNGTLISDSFLNLLSKYHTRFQITIDGDKECHNNIRKYKSKDIKQDSYSKIIHSLYLLNNSSKNFFFNIRINYDGNVLKNFEKLISDIDFLDRKRTVISLHKVWQYKSSEDEANMAINAINFINKHHFVVNTQRLCTNFSCCYADNYNEAVINYDGKVFKCTARNFLKEKPVGQLNSLGVIKWNTKEITKRLSLELPSKCKECKLLPSCPGICSQKRLETQDINSIDCPFERNLTLNDIILLNIKQQLIMQENENN